MKTEWPWSGLGSALIGAASLHAIAAVVVSGGFAPPTPPLPASRAAEQPRLTIELRPAPVVATVAVPALAPAPAAEPPVDAAPAAPDPGTEPALMPAAPPTPLADPDALEGVRYFSISEVDKPAVPRPDWQVDVPLLMGLGVRSFSVDVLIDAAGTPERCEVTRIEPDQSPELRDTVAATLCETVLSPAMRRGVAVRSIRHIELLLAPP